MKTGFPTCFLLNSVSYCTIVLYFWLILSSTVLLFLVFVFELYCYTIAALGYRDFKIARVWELPS